MKWFIFSQLLIAILVTACAPTSEPGAITPPTIDTGVDSEAWATIPAGEFPYGQHDHMTEVDDYQIMITDVTVEQYANFLNDALASGKVNVGDFEVEAGEAVWHEEGAGGYYGGEPFDEYKHEEEIKAGDHLYMPFAEGVRLTFDDQTFSSMPAYANHPMTMVTWFGANAYCEFYDSRLPTEIEWEKAARGTEIINGHGLPFPWGEEIEDPGT